MPAYVIVRADITDPVQYQKYLDAVPHVIEKYGGTAIDRAPAPVTLEGPVESRRIVVLQFPTVDRAREFYTSPEYCPGRKLRQDAAVGEMVIVEGVGPDNPVANHHAL